MSNSNNIHKSMHQELSVIRLEGEIDARNASHFEQALQSEIDAGRFNIIVGCEKLTYISSAGLGVFMSFIEEVREKGGDIKIFGMPQELKDIVDTLGFSDIYDMVDDFSTAVQRFAEPQTRKD